MEQRQQPVGADWFEVTNTGATPSTSPARRSTTARTRSRARSRSTASPASLPGESVIFIEGNAATAAEFQSRLGPARPLQIGSYSGCGIGLSHRRRRRQPVRRRPAAASFGVTFGASTTVLHVRQRAGRRRVTALSVAGGNGAFTAGGETGSPGAIAPRLIISEVAPVEQRQQPVRRRLVRGDQHRRARRRPHRLEGRRQLQRVRERVALNGVPSIAPGESVIFLEGTAGHGRTAFKRPGLGTVVPAGCRSAPTAAAASGSRTDGDAVNLFDAGGSARRGRHLRALDDVRLHVRQRRGPERRDHALSVAGVNGAFTATGDRLARGDRRALRDRSRTPAR